MRPVCESCGSSIVKVILSDQSHRYVSQTGDKCTWTYSLLKCGNCGLGFISPKPSWTILQTFYPVDYGPYASGTALPINESGSIKYKIARWRFATYLSPDAKGRTATAVGRLAELVTGRTVSYSLGIPLQMRKDSRILEVGYGSGNWLLSMAMLGYTELSGYDIDANRENKTRLEEAGVKVLSGDFLDLKLPSESYDCIRLEHVFEHLSEPMQVLRELQRLLKPGGVMVMNFPGINSVAFDFSPRHCAHRDSPRHLYLHTQRSAKNMLMNAGFSIGNVRQYGVALVLQATINNWLGERGSNWSVRWIAIISPLYNAYCVLKGRGENITVLAKK